MPDPKAERSARGGEGASASPQAGPQEERSRRSCIPHMDALWFCYSPVHQVGELYRYKELDDCNVRWEEMWDCMMNRKREDGIYDYRKRRGGGAPLWTIRKPGEAEEWWSEQFGHIWKEADGAPQPSS